MGSTCQQVLVFICIYKPKIETGTDSWTLRRAKEMTKSSAEDYMIMFCCYNVILVEVDRMSSLRLLLLLMSNVA